MTRPCLAVSPRWLSCTLTAPHEGAHEAWAYDTLPRYDTDRLLLNTVLVDMWHDALCAECDNPPPLHNGLCEGCHREAAA